MQKSKNNAYNPKEKGPLFARSISQTGAFNYTRFFFPLTSGTLKERTGKLRKERAGDESCTLHTI
ncbi:hypothetical protein EROP_03490 [Erysipelotrichaceae bacterium OPF54]|nr:hypothetical protein EROP_03490 [Erysipelotrichaceae bacterium OPF54]